MHLTKSPSTHLAGAPKQAPEEPGLLGILTVSAALAEWKDSEAVDTFILLQMHHLRNQVIQILVHPGPEKN